MKGKLVLEHIRRKSTLLNKNRNTNWNGDILRINCFSHDVNVQQITEENGIQRRRIGP